MKSRNESGFSGDESNLHLQAYANPAKNSTDLVCHGHQGRTGCLVPAVRLPPLPAKLTPLHFDHQGGLMEQSYASLQRGRQG